MADHAGQCVIGREAGTRGYEFGDDLAPGGVSQGRVRLQGWSREDQPHTCAMLRHRSFVKFIERHYAPVNHLGKRNIMRLGVELLSKVAQAFVELSPRNVVLGGEVSEQSPTSDAHRPGDLFHRRVVESLILEQAERSLFDRSVIGRRRSSLGAYARGVHVGWNLAVSQGASIVALSAIKI